MQRPRTRSRRGPMGIASRAASPFGYVRYDLAARRPVRAHEVFRLLRFDDTITLG